MNTKLDDFLKDNYQAILNASAIENAFGSGDDFCKHVTGYSFISFDYPFESVEYNGKQIPKKDINYVLNSHATSVILPTIISQHTSIKGFGPTPIEVGCTYDVEGLVIRFLTYSDNDCFIAHIINEWVNSDKRSDIYYWTTSSTDNELEYACKLICVQPTTKLEPLGTEFGEYDIKFSVVDLCQNDNITDQCMKLHIQRTME